MEHATGICYPVTSSAAKGNALQYFAAYMLTALLPCIQAEAEAVAGSFYTTNDSEAGHADLMSCLNKA